MIVVGRHVNDNIKMLVVFFQNRSVRKRCIDLNVPDYGHHSRSIKSIVHIDHITENISHWFRCLDRSTEKLSIQLNIGFCIRTESSHFCNYLIAGNEITED